jgi:hypothetical protein
MAFVPSPAPQGGRPAHGRARYTRPRFDPLYCGTNGCTTRLIADAGKASASCPICGFTRSLSATR